MASAARGSETLRGKTSSRPGGWFLEHQSRGQCRAGCEKQTGSCSRGMEIDCYMGVPDTRCKFDSAQAEESERECIVFLIQPYSKLGGPWRPVEINPTLHKSQDRPSLMKNDLAPSTIPLLLRDWSGLSRSRQCNPHHAVSGECA